MGTAKAKGKAGAVKNYINRNQALKKLQISLADFRRLCILKGIYPREPRNRKKASGNGNSALRTYYYTKDIQFLAHEPLLQKFRDHRAFLKKLNKFYAKREYKAAEVFQQNAKPTYRLDHIIKERYPAFSDALRDIDDALCLVFLFSQISGGLGVRKEKVDECVELVSAFQKHVAEAHALRKVFLSIKGIYYQAELQGQTVTWVAPYSFNQTVPADVDLRVMKTFLEFYTALLGFVVYKLNSDFTLSKEVNSDLDKFESAETDEKDAVSSTENKAPPLLFEGYCFNISREVNAQHFAFMATSFGGKVAATANGKEVTHVIVDRDLPVEQQVAGKIYVQPQWIADSINAGKAIDHEPYGIGKICPAHMSPFVVYENGAYNPTEDISVDERAKLQREIDEASDDDSASNSENESDSNDVAEFDADEDASHDEEEVEEIAVAQGEVAKKVQEVEDPKKLAQRVMPKKDLKLYRKIMRTKKLKEEQATDLKRKRLQIESTQKSQKKNKK